MGFDTLFMPGIILCVGILTIWLGFRRFLSLSGNGPRKCLRWIERAVLLPVILLLLCITGVSALNTVKIWSFHPHESTPGEINLVDGHMMHINCTGSGSPTLVLESGWGSSWQIWIKVQAALSKTTRVCSYDRPGYGYSDAQPDPRDADHIAIELHSLLTQAKITGPIVLMGHSVGGLFIRDYATRYPEEVAGLVFVDAVSPSWGLGKVNAFPHWFARLGLRTACSTNTFVLVGSCAWPRPGTGPRWKLAIGGLCHQQVCALGPESDSFARSGEETVQTGPYGALPILIISHDPAKWPADWENAWSTMQEDLKKLSTRSRRIVARNSTHVIQLERPDLLNKEVPLFIEQIRGTAAQPASYGSTVTE